MTHPRVLLADDHRMVAEGLIRLLTPEFEVVGVVEDGRALITAAKKLNPDVIVADISMPHLNGLEALVQLEKQNPEVRVVFLTMHKEVAYARRALGSGSVGLCAETLGARGTGHGRPSRAGGEDFHHAGAGRRGIARRRKWPAVGK